MQGFPGPLMPPLPPFTGLQLRAWSDLRGEGNRSNIWTGFLFTISKLMWIDLCFLYFWRGFDFDLFVYMYLLIYRMSYLSWHWEQSTLIFFYPWERKLEKKQRRRKEPKQHNTNLIYFTLASPTTPTPGHNASEFPHTAALSRRTHSRLAP